MQETSEWVGWLISMIVITLLSYLGNNKSSSSKEEEDHQLQELKQRMERDRARRELVDDEEEDVTLPLPPPRPYVQKTVPVAAAGYRSSYLEAHEKRRAQQALSSGYRLKNALSGFKQRRPIDQRKQKSAIETRSFGTMQVSDFLRVDSDAQARLKKEQKLQKQREEEFKQVRQGVLWSEILQPPLSLRKGVTRVHE